MKNIIIPIMLCLASVSCVTTREHTITPTQSVGNEVMYHDGRSFLFSTKSRSKVILSAGEKQNRLYLAFVIENLSKQRFDVAYEDITATDENGTHLNIVSEKKIAAEARAGAALANFGYAMQMAGAGMSGGQQNTYHSGTASDVYGNRYNYSGTATTYNQQAQQNELNRIRNEQSEYNREVEGSVSHATSDMLKRTTIFPGQSHLATAYFDYPETLPTHVKIYINIGGDTHTFTYYIEAP